ncbi:hypothetical protein AUEXF2481DRAFT_232980 [Aureobasidium subglaciale EXF-2481]|uniref:Uncharacterized protein n=1 Tax=Aureobasidium subglaciale (strain EXF-2481) TaxID=1043005 RepID=A0A074YLR5_AURSE|nr:uncharacterized protein AUEXF2481DRAFT_232980 [Aureobasidium subglaciale EXF-2481]KEQ95047.1 hypothetical protein AUEXF2481DRAFT_232980 [Aureobasidium subglaciale EXF-2481]
METCQQHSGQIQIVMHYVGLSGGRVLLAQPHSFSLPHALFRYCHGVIMLLFQFKSKDRYSKSCLLLWLLSHTFVLDLRLALASETIASGLPLVALLGLNVLIFDDIDVHGFLEGLLVIHRFAMFHDLSKCLVWISDVARHGVHLVRVFFVFVLDVTVIFLFKLEQQIFRSSSASCQPFFVIGVLMILASAATAATIADADASADDVMVLRDSDNAIV